MKMLLTMNASQTGEKDNELQKSTDVIVTDKLTELNEMKSRMSILKKELEESKGNLNFHMLYFNICNNTLVYTIT